MTRARTTTLAVLVGGALALAPATAQAVTVSYTADGTLVYAAEPGETLGTDVGYGVDSIGEYASFYGDFGSDAYHPDSTAAGACDLSNGELRCSINSTINGVRVVGGAGNDDITFFDADLGGFPANTPYALSAEGGDGNDYLLGGDAGETLSGGPGTDKLTGMRGDDVLDGGDGNDTLFGDDDDQHNNADGGGNDVLHGGAGDDTLTGDSSTTNATVGHDILDGGPGTDTVKNDWYRFDGNANDEDPPATVTLDGVANDGRPGENDDVENVENLELYMGGTAVGDAAANSILLFDPGTISGGDGNDVLQGSDGADTIDAGAGDDQISGGFGDDTITGGPGKDSIRGDRSAACFYGPLYGTCTTGSGNDTIYAQDGEADSIDCDEGADTAYVDAIDTVANCETVHVAGGGTPPPPPPPGPQPPPIVCCSAPKVPAGLRITRAKIRHRRLIVHATIASAANGDRVGGVFKAAAGRLRFHVKVEHGAVRVAEALPKALRHAHAGRVKLRYAGSDRVKADRAAARIEPAKHRRRG